MPKLSLFFVVALTFAGCSQHVLDKKKQNVFQKTLNKHEVGEVNESQVGYRKLCRQAVKAACYLAYPQKKLSKFSKKPERKKRKNVGAMQSATFENTTVISLIEPYRTQRQYFFLDKESGELLDESQISMGLYTHSGSPWAVKEFTLSKLDSSDSYRMLVVDEHFALVDVRDFQTFSPEGEELKFALLSCMNDQKKKGAKKMWQKVRHSGPELLFMIGDNVYADVLDSGREVKEASPDQLWLRYVQMRKRLNVYHWGNLIPVYGLWDDHDYCVNNGGKEYTYKEQSEKIFHRFFPQRQLYEKRELKPGPGISYRLNVRGQNFYFLDGRSFRDAGEEKNGEHLGRQQTEWFFRGLESENRFSWAIMGDQFFGAHHPFESFEGLHPKKFSSFLDGLKKRRQTPIIFASGDRHFSQIMNIPRERIGRKTYQFTSSPVHSSVYPGSLKEYPNPHQLKGIDGVYSFLNFTTQVSKEKLSMQVEAIGLTEKPYFSADFSVER